MRFGLIEEYFLRHLYNKRMRDKDRSTNIARGIVLFFFGMGALILLLLWIFQTFIGI